MQSPIGTSQTESGNKWVLLLLCSTANFLVYFHRVTPGVMVNELMAEFGGTAALIGLLSSAYFYAYTIMQIPVGFLADRIAIRYLIGFGILLAGAASLLFGVAQDMTTAIIARTLTGFGVSTVLVPSYKALSSAFGKKFIMANGILMAAGAAGALAASSPLVLLIDAAGWRAAFFVMAGASVLVAVPCLMLIKGPWDDRTTVAGQPMPSGREGLIRNFGKALLPGTVAFFKYGPLVAFQGLWGVPFLMDVHGLSKVGASKLLLLLSVSTMTGGLLAGQIAERTKGGSRKMLLASSALFAACWIPLVLRQGPALLPFIYVSVLLMGASDILVLILINNYITSTTDIRIKGTVLGMVNSLTLLGGAMYQPAMGLIVNGLPSGYRNAFLLGLAGALISFAATNMLSRKMPKPSR